MPATFPASKARNALLSRLVRDTIRQHGVHGFGVIADACKPLIEDLIADEDAAHGDSDRKSALGGVLAAVEQLAAETDMAGDV